MFLFCRISVTRSGKKENFKMFTCIRLQSEEWIKRLLNFVSENPKIFEVTHGV